MEKFRRSCGDADDFQQKLEAAAAYDDQIDVAVKDKLLDSAFAPMQASETPVCIHTSRSITC